MSEKMIACNLTLDEIKELADKVETGKLSKLKIKSSEGEIVIEKEMTIAPAAAQVSMPAAPALQDNSSAAAPKEEEAVSGNIVKAPIVGTFYSKPAPDKAPFVAVGSAVKKGDVIMIIESMKLMNEVTSEFDGIVKKILVEDGTAVEFDQPIMIIE